MVRVLSVHHFTSQVHFDLVILTSKISCQNCIDITNIAYKQLNLQKNVCNKLFGCVKDVVCCPEAVASVTAGNHLLLASPLHQVRSIN